jgi:hypothetical protein
VFSPGIQRLLDRLRKRKGEFAVNRIGQVRHRAILNADHMPCCPMSAECGGIPNWYFDTFRHQLGLLQDECDGFADAADDAYGHDPALRQAIVEACV